MIPLLPARTIDASDSAHLRMVFGASVTVLAPHCDDAPYSLAGVMRALAAAGVAVDMLTVFGRSGYAPNRPELNVDQVSALRHDEDRAAASVIDPRVAVTCWDHADVAERCGLAVEQVVSRQPLDADALAWVDRLTEQLAPLGAGNRTLLAPMAMGWHIDHRIVASAAVQLASAGQFVHFYEDLPYAGFTRTSRLWLAQAWRLRVLGIPLRPVDVRTPGLASLKRAVFNAYASQASDAFWYGIERQTGRRGSAERLWLCKRRTGST